MHITRTLSGWTLVWNGVLAVVETACLSCVGPQVPDELEAFKPFIFSRLDNVRHTAGGDCCIPRAHNMSAVDALQQPSNLFKVILTQETAVHVGGLARARRQLWRLYFVVPGSLFASYKAVQGLDTAIEQLALMIPGFDSWW